MKIFFTDCLLFEITNYTRDSTLQNFFVTLSATFTPSTIVSTKTLFFLFFTSKLLTKPLRLLQPIALFIFLFFLHLSSILQLLKLINNITLYITIKNLYIKFYKKLKFSNLIFIQNRLHFVFFFD